MAQNGDLKSRNIINQGLENLSPAAKALLTEKKMRDIGSHLSRKKNPDGLGEPEYFEELTEELLRKFIDGNREELLCERITEPSNMVILGTKSNRHILRECPVWSIDSTFKVVFCFTIIVSNISIDFFRYIFFVFSQCHYTEFLYNSW